MSYTLILLVKAMLNINGAYILALMESAPKLEAKLMKISLLQGRKKRVKINNPSTIQ